MDDTVWMAWAGFLLGLLSTVYAAVNHKRIRSNCCGKNLEASLDIGPTTPQTAPGPESKGPP